MLHRRLLTTLTASLVVALVAAAGLAGSASSAAADGFYFGYNDGPRMPPPRWGWGPPPPHYWGGHGWGAPGWERPGYAYGPPPTCRPRWIDRPIVDPWGRVIRYERMQVMDCGSRYRRW